jgi:hypothetical protein
MVSSQDALRDIVTSPSAASPFSEEQLVAMGDILQLLRVVPTLPPAADGEAATVGGPEEDILRSERFAPLLKAVPAILRPYEKLSGAPSGVDPGGRHAAVLEALHDVLHMLAMAMAMLDAALEAGDLDQTDTACEMLMRVLESIAYRHASAKAGVLVAGGREHPMFIEGTLANVSTADFSLVSRFVDREKALGKLNALRANRRRPSRFRPSRAADPPPVVSSSTTTTSFAPAGAPPASGHHARGGGRGRSSRRASPSHKAYSGSNPKTPGKAQ